MKRFCLAITLVMFVFVTTGCSQSKMVGIPDGYIDKEEYYDKNGVQDYTDYAKYVWQMPNESTNWSTPGTASEWYKRYWNKSGKSVVNTVLERNKLK